MQWDPIAAGIAASLARPQGNFTGLAFPATDLAVKRLQLLRETLPRATRVAVLWHRTREEGQLKAVRDAASSLKFQVISLEVRNIPGDLDEAVRMATQQHVEALLVLSSPAFFPERKHLADLSLKHRLPTSFPREAYAEAGGLMAFGADIPRMWQRLGDYADRISEGSPAERPADRGARHVRAGGEPQDREGARPDPPARAARPGQSGDRVAAGRIDTLDADSLRWRHFPRGAPQRLSKEAGMAAKIDRNRTKFLLDEKDIPTKWYNIQADLKTPAPPVLHPGTKQPIGPADLAPLFPMELIKQEVSRERWIEIPDEIRNVYRLWRPSPLYRARRLEKALGTPAHIYYKYEGVSPAGSHKPNTAIAQAYYNKKEKVTRLSTETGAGQWGSALSLACQMFGLQCKVYMVKVSYQQKPYRRIMMETWGAQVVASPSPDTQSGKKVLEQDPNSPGSLGIAISEAVEDAATRDDTKYSLGSVLNHVLMHQTIIGLEAKKQLEKADDAADIVIGCAGGGSNFAGLSFPFAADKLTGKNKKTRIIAVEPSACPSLTKGSYVYDFGDTVGLTPLVKMHTLGHTFIPAPLHAGGLRYHGMAPLVCKLYDEGVIEAVAVPQLATFEAATQFARTEGIIPAPESAHAIRVAIEEAQRCKKEGKRRTILFNLSGHGHFDLGAYEAYQTGKLTDYEYPTEKVQEALRSVPKL